MWESGTDSSTYSDYDYNARDSGDDTVASSMLPIFATSGGKQKPKKKKGKGKKKTPAPETITSSGVSQTPIRQQQRIESEKVLADEDHYGETPIEIVEELVGKAFISVMDGHFAKLYTKIDNLRAEVSTVTPLVLHVYFWGSYWITR